MDADDAVKAVPPAIAAAGAAWTVRGKLKSWWESRPRKVLAAHVALEDQMTGRFDMRLQAVEEDVSQIKNDVAYIRGRIDGAAH